MTTFYPRLPHIFHTRTLKLSDFPEQRAEGWTIPALDYWREHHITPQILSTCYPTERGICFILYGGLGYQERIFDGQNGQRFYYPYGVNVAGMVFLPANLGHVYRQELVIVEGTADALAVSQSGYRSVAILGTMLTAARAVLLRALIGDQRQVYYIPDNDAAGMEVLERLLREYIPVKIRFLPTGFKDICDMGESDRKTFLGQILHNVPTYSCD